MTRVPEFYASLLVAETAMIGLFAAANLFLFFIFWELMVVPLFLLIGVWGGPARVYAAVKFLLFTLAGSVLMLVGMIALYAATSEDAHVHGMLDFRDLAAGKPAAGAADLAVRWPFWPPSQSRCPCFRCIPGCRMPTQKRPPPAA